MQVAGTMTCRHEVEFFLRLHGLWEAIIALPPPPDPPFDVETMEPVGVPPQWNWTEERVPPPSDGWTGGEPAWEAPELALDADRVLVLDADRPPAE
ncbi:MAG: hypothetical protein ACR2OZ_06905 [Verrucomicrobiales bacterium]